MYSVSGDARISFFVLPLLFHFLSTILISTLSVCTTGHAHITAHRSFFRLIGNFISSNLVQIDKVSRTRNNKFCKHVIFKSHGLQIKSNPILNKKAILNRIRNSVKTDFWYKFLVLRAPKSNTCCARSSFVEYNLFQRETISSTISSGRTFSIPDETNSRV